MTAVVLIGLKFYVFCSFIEYAKTWKELRMNFSIICVLNRCYLSYLYQLVIAVQNHSKVKCLKMAIIYLVCDSKGRQFRLGLARRGSSSGLGQEYSYVCIQLWLLF